MTSSVAGMNTIGRDATGDGWGLNAGELFNVVLVYEDQASALRGLALYRRLATELRGTFAFHLHLWKFAVLGLGRLADVSTTQAVEADLIIVCTRGAASPPEPVQAWFERWLELKGHNYCALVVLEEAASEDRQGGYFHGLPDRGVVTVFASTAPAVPQRELTASAAFSAPRLRQGLMAASTMALAPRSLCLACPSFEVR